MASRVVGGQRASVRGTARIDNRVGVSELGSRVGRTGPRSRLWVLGAPAKPRGGALALALPSHTPEKHLMVRTLPWWLVGPASSPGTLGRARACVRACGVASVGRPWMAVSAHRHTQGPGLFLRQSCILILDVFPEAYFS